MDAFFTVINNTSDISFFVRDFTTPKFQIDLETANQFYVGYKKPFNTFYCEVEGNVVANSFTVEAFVDGVWSELEVLDETEGFTKSGFITFHKPDKWNETEIEGKTKFFIRLKPSNNHTSPSYLHGLAILLSNDLDLIEIRSNIVSKHNNGNSWVTKHQAARKYIIQEIRNSGNKIIQKNNVDNSPFQSGLTRFVDVTEFDLLQPFELRMASKYKTLSSIYLDELSDEKDDKWFTQGERYEDEFSKMMNIFFLKLDTDDDGIESAKESQNSSAGNLTWQ